MTDLAVETTMSFEKKSFWMETRPYTPGPPLTGDVRADVVIVGGGFTGLSTAYHLKTAAPALRVALLESDIIGHGASGRNGGFNMTLFGLTLGITALRFGRSKAREAHLYMEKAVDLLRNLAETLPLDCDYEHPGFLRVATSEKYRRRILDEIALAHALGIDGISWMPPDRLAEEIRSPQYLGAWWEPRCGLVNPAKLAWSWRDVVAGMGVSVFEGTPVMTIQRMRGGYRLTTPGGRVVSEKLVLATNAYSHLIPQIGRRQTPVWTYIVLTEPLSPAHFEAIGWRHRQGIEDARNLVHYYRLTADNRLVMGGRDVGLAYGTNMDRDLDPRTFSALEQDVRDIFPALKDIAFTHRWGGPVSVTVDMAPAMGYLGDPSAVYSLGCMGHGVSMTHLNGKTAADLLLERKTALTDVFFVNRRTLPWPPEPVRTAMAKAILGYMHLEDSLYDPRIR